MKKSSKVAVAVLIVAITGLGVGSAMARGGFCNDHPRMMMGGPKGFMNNFTDRDLNLTEKEIRTLVEARLIMRGNDRLKIGKIAMKEDTTYVVDIVTVDDSLVRQVEIDKKTGRPAFMSRKPK